MRQARKLRFALGSVRPYRAGGRGGGCDTLRRAEGVRVCVAPDGGYSSDRDSGFQRNTGKIQKINILPCNI